MTDVIVVGGGPAGLTAGLYLARAGRSVLVLEESTPGGQINFSPLVENYPGLPRVAGSELGDTLAQQAQDLGAQLEYESVTAVTPLEDGFQVDTDCGSHTCKGLILATGVRHRPLGLPGEEDLVGQGISYCAVCDGPFCTGKPVAVVGGGDTACEEATYLASICRQVYMIVRKPYLRASKAMQHRVMNTPNIEVLFEYNTAEVLGDDTGVTGVTIRHNDGKERTLAVAGFFVAIGHHPNTELFRNQLELDAEGYIRTEGNSSKTSVEGVFAAGDVQDPAYRQAITAAGSGCIAALDCERFLLQ